MQTTTNTREMMGKAGPLTCSTDAAHGAKPTSESGP
jgi:hypothetical protein